MSHLDEGMIHTWLDGELSPVEGAALQSHAAGCAPCAALVAEARGLMAASTRILDALDNVPVGVMPQAGGRVSVATEGEARTAGQEEHARPALVIERKGGGVRPEQVQRRRPFYRHPQFAAAAALVIVAFGTWTVRQRLSPHAAAVSPQVMNEAREPGVNEVMDSAAPARATSAAERPAGTAPPSDALQRKRDNTPRQTDSVSLLAASAKASLDKAPSATDPVLADEQRRDRASSRAELAAAPPPLPVPATAGAAGRASDSSRSRAAESVSEPRRLALSPDSLVAKERDRVSGELKTQAQGTRQAAAASQPAPLGQVATTGSAFAGASGSPGIACYDLARSAAALEAHVPPRVQLLETRGPTTGDRLWKRVRVLGDDPGTGEWFWWARPDGALLLARMEGSTVRYEVPITAPAAREVRAYAQKCP